MVEENAILLFLIKSIFKIVNFREFFSTGPDCVIHRVSIENLSILETFETEDEVKCIEFNPVDNTELALGNKIFLITKLDQTRK